MQELCSNENEVDVGNAMQASNKSFDRSPDESGCFSKVIGAAKVE